MTFTLNFIYVQVGDLHLASETVIVENNCVKTSKDRPILSAAEMFRWKSCLWQYGLCGYSRGFLGEAVSNENLVFETGFFRIFLSGYLRYLKSGDHY